MNYWTIQFQEISSRVKRPNFGHIVQLDLSESNLDGFIVLKVMLRPSGHPNVVISVIGA